MSPAALRRGLPRLLAAVAAVVLLAGCGGGSGGGSATADGKTLVRYTAVPALGALPAYVAKEEGIFERHGLEVELTPSVSGPTQMQSIGRQFDFVYNVIGQYIQFADTGQDVVLFAGTEALSDDLPTNPVITRDPSIKSIFDLPGKRVGTVSVSSASVVALRYLYAEQGADISGVEFVAVPFENQVDQIKAGRLDAIIPATGFWEHLVAEGFREVGQMPQDALKAAGAQLPLTYGVYGATREFADANPDTMRAFQDSIAEAATWIEQNRSAALDHFVAWTGRDRAQVESLTIPRYKPQVEPSDIEPWLPLFRESDMLRNPVDPVALVWRTPS